MVHGNIEETLNLVSMQVHRDNAVYTSHTQQICYQLGTDAYTWFVLTVLTSPSEVGDDGIDGACRCALGSVNHQQQFHKIVRIGESALYQENILSANALLVRNGKLAIRELRNLKLSQWTS